MKNILKYSIICAAALGALVACKNGGGKNNTPADDPEGSLWRNSVAYPATVDVYAGKTLVMSDVIETDQVGRIKTFVRTDNSLKKDLLNLAYAYSGKENVTISGSFYGGGNKSMTASCKDGVVTYQGNWNAPLLIKTTFNTDGIAQLTEFQNSADESHYSSQTSYTETYGDNGEDIEDVTVATSSEGVGKATHPTSVTTSSTVEYQYTYSDDPDLNNFNAYLMPCSFPVWYAKGLPGSTHLITGMKVSHNGRDYGVSFTVEYDFDTEGNVVEAVRKDYSGTTLVLERKYILTY